MSALDTGQIGYGLIRTFESSCFFFDAANHTQGALNLRIRKISFSNALDAGNPRQPIASISFLGFPWSNFKRIEVSVNGLGKGQIVVRICRDGTGPWEYEQLRFNGSGALTCANPFSPSHSGYRLEILENAEIDIGQQLSLTVRGLEIIATQQVLSTYNKAQPRLLIIDSTPVGNATATGQIKQMFLGSWPADRLLQVYETAGRLQLKRWLINDSVEISNFQKILEACREFQPEVIYFRPVDSEQIFQLAELALKECACPFVIHMMDDWPERLRANDAQRFNQFDHSLRQLLKRASKRLSISSAMSNEYAHRYGFEFTPLANGVDINDFPVKDWASRPRVTSQRPFLIRYMGALADDMTFNSVVDVARAVSELQARLPIRFEIFTMSWCLGKAQAAVAGMPGVAVNGLIESAKYREYLSEADLLLIAYNFDSASVRYVRLSLANKMPECLASGAVVLAYGPSEVETIAYLDRSKCARVVKKRDHELLCKEITYLATNLERCREIGEAGRKFASLRHSRKSSEELFLRVLQEAVKQSDRVGKVIIGPYSRSEAAHYDETDCIAKLFSGSLAGFTMVDVGAHFGSALLPFLDKGWKIFAFEPDERNRQKLTERLGKHERAALVKLDARAVSNESRTNLTFYRSEVSTGISGLSAFHPSHRPEQLVDTITLRDALSDQEINGVDFLKVDTEGFDLFVLKGFPWERFKPAVIECEFEDSKTAPLGYTFHDLAGFLSAQGYTVYVSEWHPIIRYGIRHDWKRLIRYPCELSNPQAWGNLLAFREAIKESDLVAAITKVLKIGAPATNVSERTPVRIDAQRAQPSTVPTVSTNHLTTPSTPDVQASSSSATSSKSTVSQTTLSGELDALSRRVRRAVTQPKIKKRSKTLVVMGNGPSLKSFDFARFRDFDVIGMNAAYRFWNQIGWYPRYYACLDLVVGLSHKDEIARLIRDRSSNGIECFLLRRNLIDALPRDLGALNCIFEFELLQASSDLFSSNMITTGSHAALFGAFLGYDRMVLMGVDCNYVEKIDGAVDRSGFELELLTKPDSNPNYFFDGYQVVGDKYNLPNPTPGLHIGSWRSIAPILAKRNVKVWNGSPISLVDAFPKVDFSEIEREELTLRHGRVRLCMRMNDPLTGQEWLPPEIYEGRSFRWTGPGSRATIHIPIRRDQEVLLVIAYHTTVTQDQLDGLRIDIDGAAVQHSLQIDINPKCVIARVPLCAKPPYASTEIGIVLPRTVAPSSVSAGDRDSRLLGLGVYWVAAMPSTPTLPPPRENPRSKLDAIKIHLGLLSTTSTPRENRVPYLYFDGIDYMAAYPDVAEAVLVGAVSSAFEHYQLHGSKDGRHFTIATDRAPCIGTVTDIFDGLGYLNSYPDVADVVRSGVESSAFEHYLKYGRRDGRPVRPRFDGLACQGTAVDLARHEATSIAKQQIEILKTQLGKEIEARANYSNRQIAESTSAAKSDIELVRRQYESIENSIRKELANATAKERGLLQQIDELKQALAAREQALSTRIEAINASIARLDDAATARASDFDHLKRETVRELDRIREEVTTAITVREAREQAVLEQIELIRIGLDESQRKLAVAARAEDLDRMKRETVRELDHIREEVSNAVTVREAREQAVLEQIELIRIGLDESQRKLAVAARAEDLDRLQRDADRNIERVRGEIVATANVESARSQAVLAQIDALKAEISSAKTRAELAELKVASTQRELDSGARQVAGSVSDLGSTLESAKAEIAKVQSELVTIKHQTASTGNRVNHPSIGAFNVLGYQAHSRTLLKNHADRMMVHWVPLLGLSIQEKELYYLAHRICSIENVCVGRLAASVDDVLLRILVARAIKARKIEMLEIGTLFGVGVGAMHEALSPLFDEMRFTVIDPLDGYYGSANKDVLTGVPVSRAVFDENLRRARVEPAGVDVIQLLSTDAKALQRARKRKYDLLVIDADHTYNGVKHDAENYVRFTREGGYVIFDDYGNQFWPDVKKYVDAEIMPRPDLKFVGAEWHTAVFQIVSAGIR